MDCSSCGVLFDLDGVLIDSETAYTRFWAGIDRMYPTGIEDFALHIKGTTLPEILTHYPDDAVRADIERRIGEFQDCLRFSLFEGAAAFLDQLACRGIPKAIVTSSDKAKMERLFTQLPMLRRHFPTVIDASKVTLSKPHPQGYLLGAEAIGVDPERCYVFEDSLQGLKAGRAAGATVIGVATTYPRSVVGPYADCVIDGLWDFDVDRMLDVSKP